MLIRIVKMTFEEKNTSAFEESFKSVQKTILEFKGCKHVELLQDMSQNNVYFTYSYWESENDLNDYRQSDFFKKVWAKTKKWFSDKPIAWSLDRIVDTNGLKSK